ncbi:MAG: GtrA family protein [Deltaproteobacteria bacterium]|nr:GtrA family protein [Deltaproteobacteria bacterium]
MFAFLIFIGLNYQLAIVFGTILCVLFNFKTMRKYVFGDKGFKLVLLLKFISVYTIGILLNLAGMRIMLNFIHSEYIAGFILILPISIVTYLLNRFYVFSHYSPKQNLR